MRRFHFDFAKSLIKLNAITRYSLFQYRPSNGELISEKNHFCTVNWMRMKKKLCRKLNHKKINCNVHLIHVNSSKSPYNYRWWTDRPTDRPTDRLLFIFTWPLAKKNQQSLNKAAFLWLQLKPTENHEMVCNRCATKINRVQANREEWSE